MANPRFGEVWNAPSGSVLPGGMLCLIVSSDDFNRIRRQYVIVEVISDALSGDAIICDRPPRRRPDPRHPRTLTRMIGYFQMIFSRAGVSTIRMIVASMIRATIMP